MLDLLDDLLLNTLLFLHGVLHGGALLEGIVGLAEQLLELADLERAGLLEGHSAAAATMQVEVAIVAKGLVVVAAVGLQGVLVGAHPNLRLGSGLR